MADQYAITFDHLRILASKYSPEATGLVGKETVKSLLRRWRKAGLIEGETLSSKFPTWYWLSEDGMNLLLTPFPYREPAQGKLNHIWWVNAVRLLVESKVENAVWIPERKVSAERKRKSKRHLVDGEVYTRGHVVGVEVELTQKSWKRMENIITELEEDYEYVWYYVTHETESVVKRAIEAYAEDDNTFQVYMITNEWKD